MNDKRNYVIMMYTDEKSEYYGEPLKVEGFLESKHSLGMLEGKIEKWKDLKAKPVLIKDELIIKLFDAKYRREESEETELQELRSELKRVAENLNMLAFE